VIQYITNPGRIAMAPPLDYLSNLDELCAINRTYEVLVAISNAAT